MKATKVGVPPPKKVAVLNLGASANVLTTNKDCSLKWLLLGGNVTDLSLCVCMCGVLYACMSLLKLPSPSLSFPLPPSPSLSLSLSLTGQTFGELRERLVTLGRFP